MKKVFSALVIASALFATVADAGSIGRGGGGGFGGGRSSMSSGSSSRSSSFSAPSRPSPAPSVAPAPAPVKPGGIGGTTSSVGVRKSDVTAPVAQQVRPTTPTTTPSHSNSIPTYGSAPQPNYGVGGYGGVTNGSTFMSSLGGSFLGSWIGSSLGHSGSHGGGTTVINNGTPVATNAPGVMSSGDGSVASNGMIVVPKKEYTVWSFIADLFGFVIVVAMLLAIGWLFYKGFQLIRNYINKERGVSTQPFNPTKQFWQIQNAFSLADVDVLKTLLGPDVVDELTNGLTPSTITLHNVSHEVRLANNTEFSVWYKFEDDGEEVNQVWHYEKFGREWLLNGIENV